MIRELLVIVGLLALMGVLYVVVRWGAGRWNRFMAEQADKIQVSTRADDPNPGAGTPSAAPEDPPAGDGPGR